MTKNGGRTKGGANGGGKQGNKQPLGDGIFTNTPSRKDDNSIPAIMDTHRPPKPTGGGKKK